MATIERFRWVIVTSANEHQIFYEVFYFFYFFTFGVQKLKIGLKNRFLGKWGKNVTYWIASVGSKNFTHPTFWTGKFSTLALNKDNTVRPFWILHNNVTFLNTSWLWIFFNQIMIINFKKLTFYFVYISWSSIHLLNMWYRLIKLLKYRIIPIKRPFPNKRPPMFFKNNSTSVSDAPTRPRVTASRPFILPFSWCGGWVSNSISNSPGYKWLRVWIFNRGKSHVLPICLPIHTKKIN